MSSAVYFVAKNKPSAIPMRHGARRSRIRWFTIPAIIARKNAAMKWSSLIRIASLISGRESSAPVAARDATERRTPSDRAI